MGGCISSCKDNKGLNAASANLRQENSEVQEDQLVQPNLPELIEPTDLLYLNNNKILHKHSSCVRVLAFSQDNKWIASGSDDHTIFLYNLIEQTYNQVLEGHTSYILSIAFSKDSQWLASAGEDSKVYLWNLLNSYNNRTIVDHVGSILSVTFSPNNQWLASGGSDNIVRLWNITDQNNKQYLKGHSGSILDLAFSENMQWLASSSVDSTIRLWDLQNFQHQILKGHSKSVLSISFSTDSYWLASGSMDNTLRLWCVSSSKDSQIMSSENNLHNVLFSPNNYWLAYCSGNKLHLYCLEDSTKNHILQGHNNNISSISFSQDNHWLASGGKDNTIKLWDLTNPINNNYTLNGHNLSVNSIVFSENGRWLASGGADNTVRLWDISLYNVTGERLATYKATNSQSSPLLDSGKNSEASYDIMQSPIRRTVSIGASKSWLISEEIGDKFEMSMTVDGQVNVATSLEKSPDSSNSQSSPVVTSGENSQSSWGIIESSKKKAESFKAKRILSSISLLSPQNLLHDLENMSINDDEKQDIEKLEETTTTLFFSSVHVIDEKLPKTESKKGKEKQTNPIGKFTKIMPL